MQAISLTVLQLPNEEPVTVDEARTAARVDDNRFDDQLPTLIQAARQMAEHECGRVFVQQQWRAKLDGWPGSEDVIRVAPATAVAVSYYNTAGVWVVLDGAAYVWEAVPSGVVLAPAGSGAWPALGSLQAGARVRVDVTAGEPTNQVAQRVPACVKLYIKAHVSAWLRTPEAFVATKLEPIPSLARLLDPLRVY